MVAIIYNIVTCKKSGVNQVKKYLIIFLVIVFGASMLLIGISCNYGAPSTVKEEAVAEKAVEPEVKSRTDHEVIIENFAFDSSDLTIKAGDTVTWTNNDGAPHTVKIDTFESDNLSRDDTFSFTFSDAGTYAYICGIHSYMQGRIIVE